jgi:hypothetical protein
MSVMKYNYEHFTGVYQIDGPLERRRITNEEERARFCCSSKSDINRDLSYNSFQNYNV